jgi:hypothetical protein
MRGSADYDSLKDDLKNWRNRRKQYLEWKKSHTLIDVSIGDKVDIRDTEYIWCSGSVERILKSRYNCADLYFVHYEGWSRCYDEYIPADSDRIAPHKLYTSRNDIPKYTRHDGPDERVYGNVVEGGNESPRNNNNRAENNTDNNEQPQGNRANEPAEEQAPLPEPSPALERDSNAAPNTNTNEEDKDEEEEAQQSSTIHSPSNRPNPSNNSC